MTDRIANYDTLWLDEQSETLAILDQTLLPGQVKVLRLRRPEDIREAIAALRVRGAPAIGVAAGIGLYVASLDFTARDRGSFLSQLRQTAEYLSAARPTAVNLSWTLSRMVRAALQAPGGPVQLRQTLREECMALWREDVGVCRRLGEHGLTLLSPGDGILTHCNAGRLATVRYGTATAPLYLGYERGYSFRVFCDETRPLLQGARLTSLELSDAGLDVTLICDNMAASLMARGLVNAVLVGCDRVAMNGDAANKIGTLGVAVLARHFGVPFYVVAPSSTIDPHTAEGGQIVIEERDGSEIRELWYKHPMAPDSVKTWNPAFDVTDHRLITAIVTEFGVARPPFDVSLAEVVRLRDGVM